MLLTMANGQDEVRMTLRVSHDSGRTWGPTTEVRVGNDPVVPDDSGRLPPCACLMCAEQNSSGSRRVTS